MQQMNKKIVKYTLIFSLFCSIACAMIFHSQMIQVFIAVWIGCLTGLVGYRKIDPVNPVRIRIEGIVRLFKWL